MKRMRNLVAALAIFWCAGTPAAQAASPAPSRLPETVKGTQSAADIILTGDSYSFDSQARILHATVGIASGDGTALSGVLLQLKLIGNQAGDAYGRVLYSAWAPGDYQALPGEPKSVSADFPVPSAIGAGRYLPLLSAYSGGNYQLGQTQGSVPRIDLEGKGGFLTIQAGDETEQADLNGKKVGLGALPYLASTDKLTLYPNVNNPGDARSAVLETSVYRWGKGGSTLVDGTRATTAVTIAKGVQPESAAVVLSALTPGSYEIRMRFLDSAGNQVSNQRGITIIMGGAFATVRSVKGGIAQDNGMHRRFTADMTVTAGYQDSSQAYVAKLVLSDGRSAMKTLEPGMETQEASLAVDTYGLSRAESGRLLILGVNGAVLQEVPVSFPAPASSRTAALWMSAALTGLFVLVLLLAWFVLRKGRGRLRYGSVLAGLFLMVAAVGAAYAPQGAWGASTAKASYYATNVRHNTTDAYFVAEGTTPPSTTNTLCSVRDGDVVDPSSCGVYIGGWYDPCHNLDGFSGHNCYNVMTSHSLSITRNGVPYASPVTPSGLTANPEESYDVGNTDSKQQGSSMQYFAYFMPVESGTYVFSYKISYTYWVEYGCQLNWQNWSCDSTSDTFVNPDTGYDTVFSYAFKVGEPGTPTISASLNPSTVMAGDGYTLKWNSKSGAIHPSVFVYQNGKQIPSDGYRYPSSYSMSGTTLAGGVTRTVDYTLRACVFYYGRDPKCSNDTTLTITVNVPSAPTVTRGPDPSPVVKGDSVNLSWSVAGNYDSLVFADDKGDTISSSVPSITVKPDTSQTYSLTACYQGTCSQKVGIFVRVMPKITIVNLSPNPNPKDEWTPPESLQYLEWTVDMPLDDWGVSKNKGGQGIWEDAHAYAVVKDHPELKVDLGNLTSVGGKTHFAAPPPGGEYDYSVGVYAPFGDFSPVIPLTVAPVLTAPSGDHVVAKRDPLTLTWGVTGSWDKLVFISENPYSAVEVKSLSVPITPLGSQTYKLSACYHGACSQRSNAFVRVVPKITIVNLSPNPNPSVAGDAPSPTQFLQWTADIPEDDWADQWRSAGATASVDGAASSLLSGLQLGDGGSKSFATPGAGIYKYRVGVLFPMTVWSDPIPLTVGSVAAPVTPPPVTPVPGPVIPPVPGAPNRFCGGE